MRPFMIAVTTLALAATAAQADTQVFQSIIGDAAKIQRDAEAISMHLKAKRPDFDLVKSKSSDLGKDIQELRGDLDGFEAQNPNLTAEQKKSWEMVKTKAQLLLVFSDAKNNLLNGNEVQKNRSLLRAYSDGIAKRAVMLQETAKKLDR